MDAEIICEACGRRIPTYLAIDCEGWPLCPQCWEKEQPDDDDPEIWGDE